MPSGPISLAMDLAAELVAASATFQAWVGFVGDATGAKTRVYRPAVEGRGAQKYVRPFCRVSLPDITRLRLMLGTVATGNLLLVFEDAVAAGDAASHEAAALAFCDKVGAIAKEMLQAVESPTAARLFVHSLDISMPQRSPNKEKDDYYRVFVLVQYGPQA